MQELKNIIIKYYTSTDSVDLLNNVLFDIFNCENDLHQHCEVEDELFVPAVQLLEAKVDVEGGKSEKETISVAQQEMLSEREREIVGCIVRGMTNKEIAEKPFHQCQHGADASQKHLPKTQYPFRQRFDHLCHC